jgi:hypothetical protein
MVKNRQVIMNKHLHNILDGVAGLWPVPRDYIHPTGGGFIKDAKAMRGDFSSIAKDMKKSLNKNEQTQTMCAKAEL